MIIIHVVGGWINDLEWAMRPTKYLHNMHCYFIILIILAMNRKNDYCCVPENAYFVLDGGFLLDSFASLFIDLRMRQYPNG